MVFDLKDYKLAKAMIKDIGKEENILWQHAIKSPNRNYSVTTAINPLINIAFLLLLFSLLLSLFVIHINAVFISIVLLFGAYKGVESFINFRFKKEKKKFFQYSQYLITEQRILFLLYQNNKLYLYFIPFTNIKDVEVSLDEKEVGLLSFTTYHPVSFTSHFNAIFTKMGDPFTESTQKIRFEFIKFPQKTAMIVKSYL